MSPCDSVRKNWLRSEKHTKITNPCSLRTIVKDELKESRQTLLDLQQKLADGSSKRGQEIPGKMLSDDPGQPLGISWVKNVSPGCFRDVVIIHVWIVGFLATAVKTQDDPRILSLRSQRRQLEEDWREQNDQKCVHYSPPFRLNYCDGLGFVMPFHAVRPWSGGPVPCGSNSPPGRHGISRFDWRAGTAVEGEEKIGSTDFHWSTGASQNTSIASTIYFYLYDSDLSSWETMEQNLQNWFCQMPRSCWGFLFFKFKIHQDTISVARKS